MTSFNFYGSVKAEKSREIFQGRAYSDVTIRAFGQDYHLNKTLLAMQSEYFWTLFQSKLFDSAAGFFDLGSDMLFHRNVWEVILKMLHGATDKRQVFAEFTVEDTFQFLESLEYLQKQIMI